MKEVLFIFFSSVLLAGCQVSMDITIEPDQSGILDFTLVLKDTARKRLDNDSLRPNTASQSYQNVSHQMMNDILKNTSSKSFSKSIKLMDSSANDTSFNFSLSFTDIESLSQTMNVVMNAEHQTEKIVTQPKSNEYAFFLKTVEDSSASKNPKKISPIQGLSSATLDLHFPKRKIKKIEGISDVKISDDKSSIYYEVSKPVLTEKENLNFKIKVK